MIKQNEYGEPEGTEEEVYALYEKIQDLSEQTHEVRKTDTRWNNNDDLKALRGLFTEWGLKGISVRRAKGAGVWHPHVRVPQVPQDALTVDSLTNFLYRREAVTNLHTAVYKVFPCFRTQWPSNPYSDGCTIYCTFS